MQQGIYSLLYHQLSPAWFSVAVCSLALSSDRAEFRGATTANKNTLVISNYSNAITNTDLKVPSTSIATAEGYIVLAYVHRVRH